MEKIYLPVFLLNIIMILLDAALGYLSAPSLLSQTSAEPAAIEAGVRATRRVLPMIVALYMFFNCLGYFQSRPMILLTVTILVLIDLALQFFLRNRRTDDESDDQDW